MDETTFLYMHTYAKQNLSAIYIYIYIYMESLWTKAHGIKLKKIAMEETTFLCIRGQIFYFILRPNLRSIAGGWKYDSHVDLNYELPIYRYL